MSALIFMFVCIFLGTLDAGLLCKHLDLYKEKFSPSGFHVRLLKKIPLGGVYAWVRLARSEKQ